VLFDLKDVEVIMALLIFELLSVLTTLQHREMKVKLEKHRHEYYRLAHAHSRLFFISLLVVLWLVIPPPPHHSNRWPH